MDKTLVEEFSKALARTNAVAQKVKQSIIVDVINEHGEDYLLSGLYAREFDLESGIAFELNSLSPAQQIALSDVLDIDASCYNELQQAMVDYFVDEIKDILREECYNG